MSSLVPLLWVAGVLQGLVAVANLFAVRMFGYREAVRAMPGPVAEVFVVQNLFIMLTVLGAAGLSLLFAGELVGGGRLARAVSGFLACFWAVRLVVQLFFYDRTLRRRFRVFDALFVLTFIFLTGVFAAAAVGGRP